MLDFLFYLIVGLIVVVGAILALASTRPDGFAVSRTARIAAPADRLFAMINELKVMNTWNPYALRDKGGTITYRGPASGKGARFDFAGGKSGTGSIEILDATPPSRVTMRLEMVKPFKADNTIVFTLAPQGPATDVSWAMSGQQPLLAKAMTLFIDCDKMVGRDFETGLAALKAIADKA